MRRFANIVALLILLSGAAPVLTCMTGSAMSAREHDCCRFMQGNCGQMAKTGCCQTELRTNAHPQMVSAAPSMDIHWAISSWITLDAAPVQTIPASLLDAPDNHSPPGLLTAKITVLRI